MHVHVFSNGGGGWGLIHMKDFGIFISEQIMQLFIGTEEVRYENDLFLLIFA